MKKPVEDNTLWTSGGGDVVGWLNTNLFDETGDGVSVRTVPGCHWHQ